MYWVFAGLIAIALITREVGSPFTVHVAPASTDLYRVFAVLTNMVREFFGSMVIVLTGREVGGIRMLMRDHVAPPSVLFRSPKKDPV